MSGKTKLRLLVTSGDGPRECRLAVARVLRRMEREAGDGGLSFSAEPAGDTEGDDIPSALVTVSGAAEPGEAFARRWTGTVQWTVQSPFRPHHKRRNWFVGVFAVEAGDGFCEQIDPRDLRFETFRAGGPGGQHQNTTDSAVRVTHVPSGVSVIAKDERSQHRNKQVALERLEARLYFARQEEAARRQSAENLLHKRVERGNPVRCFKGTAFREV